MVVGTEACDDKNLDQNDGCSPTGRIEEGWECDASEPSICRTICGDGLKRGIETCDDGNITDD